MNLICQSVDFRNCPADTAGQLVFDIQRQRTFLHSCRDIPEISDALILNTCNRLEFYFYAARQFDISAFVDDFVSHNLWNQYKQTLYGLDAAGHLFNVASGLESQIVGENEIFSQLKSAYSFALRCDSVQTMFHRLLHSSFRVAKAVRTYTDINIGALSIAQASVELAADNCSIDKMKILVIGSGSNAELIVKHLIRKNVADITVAARNKDAGERLIEKTSAGKFVQLNELKSCLSNVDIVFTAAASGRPLITAETLDKKRVKPLIVIDLSVPPNAEPKVVEIDNIKLFNIDSLNEIISNNNRKRQTEIPKAKAIIDEHLQSFSRWLEDSKVAAR